MIEAFSEHAANYNFMYVLNISALHVLLQSNFHKNNR